MDKFIDYLKLEDKFKNYLNVYNKKTGKLIYSKPNLVVQRGRLFALEKLFNDIYTHSDNNTISNFNLKYYIAVAMGSKSTYYSPNTTPIYVSELSGAYRLLSGSERETLLADGTTQVYKYADITSFNKRHLCLFKVGRGGTTLNPLEPRVPSVTDNDLRDIIPFRIKASTDPTNLLNNYCLETVNGSFLEYYGKYFDNIDPVYIVDQSLNKICKKINMTINMNDIRDTLENGTLVNKSSAERRGKVTHSNNIAIGLPVSTIDITNVNLDGGHVQYTHLGTTKTFLLKKQSTATYLFLEKISDNFDYGVSLTLSYTDEPIKEIGAITLSENMNMTNIAVADVITYTDYLGQSNTFVVSEEDTDNFTIKMNDSSPRDIENTIASIPMFKGVSLLGLVDITLNYVYYSAVNEIGIYFAEAEISESSKSVVSGTEEMFSIITLPSKLLEDGEEYVIEYYLFA